MSCYRRFNNANISTTICICKQIRVYWCKFHKKVMLDSLQTLQWGVICIRPQRLGWWGSAAWGDLKDKSPAEDVLSRGF